MAVRTATVALPLRRAHPTGVGATERRFVLVRVDTDRDITGYGEATVLKEWGGSHGRYYGESHGTVQHLIRDYLGPVIEGEDPFQVERLHAKMNQVVRGHPYAKAAIDMALLDVRGQALGVSACDLLGGRFRAKVPVAHSIGLLNVEDAIAEATVAVEEGFRAIKLKVGLDEGRDVEVVRRVRAAVGPSVALSIDANQRYASGNRAVAIIRQLEDCNLAYVEQPVEGIDAMAHVAKRVTTSIMHDEGAWTPQDVIEIWRRQAGDLVSLYTTKPGGVHTAKKVAAVCESVGISCNVNGSGETGIGNAANLHLAASTPVVTLPCVIPVTRVAEMPSISLTFYLDDVVKEPFEYQDGHLLVPESPGLGFEIDEAKLEKYAQRWA